MDIAQSRPLQDGQDVPPARDNPTAQVPPQDTCPIQDQTPSQDHSPPQEDCPPQDNPVSHDKIPAQDPPDEVPLKKHFTALAPELHHEISTYLDYSDICHVRAASRFLRKSFPGCTSRLQKELSIAWISIDRNFGRDCGVGPQMEWIDTSASGLILDNKSVSEKVRDHLLTLGLSAVVTRWVSTPLEYRFHCSSCRALKLWSEFEQGGLETLQPYRFFEDLELDRKSWISELKALECGKCYMGRSPNYRHCIGMGLYVRFMIKCDECQRVKLLSTDIKYQRMFSQVCDNCYEIRHQEWYKYKNYLHECLATMERYDPTLGEQNYVTPADWEGLPPCPVPQSFVKKLSDKDYRPLHDTT